MASETKDAKEQRRILKGKQKATDQDETTPPSQSEAVPNLRSTRAEGHTQSTRMSTTAASRASKRKRADLTPQPQPSNACATCIAYKETCVPVPGAACAVCRRRKKKCEHATGQTRGRSVSRAPARMQDVRQESGSPRPSKRQRRPSTARASTSQSIGGPSRLPQSPPMPPKHQRLPSRPKKALSSAKEDLPTVWVPPLVAPKDRKPPRKHQSE